MQRKIEELQLEVLLDAINNYLMWRNNQSADDRGYSTHLFTWLHHYTAFGEERAKNLKQELSSNLTKAPIEIIQEHLKTNTETDDYSLSTYILENILKNKELFSITTELTSVHTQSSRLTLRQLIIDQDISSSEYTYLVAKLYERYKLPQAQKLYEKAASLGSYDAKKKLFVVENKSLTKAEQWNKLGDKYYNATKDYINAKICYEQCITLDSNYKNSLYMLGVIHEHGQGGVDKNKVTAQAFYQRAIQAGDERAVDRLHLSTIDNFLAKEKEWNKLGEDYFFGKNGKTKDYWHAKWCYERVLAFNPTHADAVENLKILSEHTHSLVTINTQEYYEKAMLNSDIKKQQLILEKIIVSDELAGMKFTKGRCWLHLLTDLPHSPLLNIQVLHDAIKKIVQVDTNSPYTRDNQGKTPFFQLNVNDPYKILSILRPFDFIGTSEKEAEVGSFLKSIKTNPHLEQHLLLVAGPPGVGKTEITKTIVNKEGFKVIEYAVDAEEDKHINQHGYRISKLFAAVAQMKEPICLFIDEIDTLLPTNKDTSTDIQSLKETVTTKFQTEIDKLKGKKIVLVGTTNYLERIKPAIRSRAGTAVFFDLPDSTNRQLIIQDLLRIAVLEPDSTIIQKIVEATSGWSPRQLKNYIEKVNNKQQPNTPLSNELFENCFEAVRKELERPKKGHAKMIAPRLTTLGATPRAMPLSDELLESSDHICTFIENSEALIKINPGYNVHTLLFGPPGGGKTEFARLIVEKTNCPCFVVNPKNSLTELAGVFSQAKSCEKAIIFIDEVDSFASAPAAAELLQTEMDGFDKPKNPLVIIAATNHLERIALPVLSRFGNKMEVLLPAEKQRSEFFKFALTDMKKRVPNVYDKSLNDEIKGGCINLGRETERFSIRDMNSVLNQITPILFKRLNSPNSANKDSLMMTLSHVISKVKATVEIESNLSFAANPSRFFSYPPKDVTPSVPGSSPVFN